MSDEPEDDGKEAARRTRIVRIGILAFVAVLVVTSVVILLVRRTHRPITTAVVRRDGGAAFSAPKARRLPGGGPHLAGVVVDGAGIPVAGAEVSAELEPNFVDRSLASAPKLDAGVASDAGASTSDAGVAST